MHMCLCVCVVPASAVNVNDNVRVCVGWECNQIELQTVKISAFGVKQAVLFQAVVLNVVSLYD